MPVDVTVEVDEGRAVVVKRAHGADATRLRAEAGRLEQMAHPGVVEVLACTESDEETVLRTRYAGRPLDALPAPTAEQVAAVLAAVADTLADLHDAGFVHGRLDGSHVLLTETGRPRLCGVGDGTTPEGVPAVPTDDVAALGTLLTELLAGGQDAEPIPDRRWRRPSWSGWTRRALLTLADQASDELSSRRPAARRLASELATVAPDARLPTTEGSTAIPGGARPRRRDLTIDAEPAASASSPLDADSAIPVPDRRGVSSPPRRLAPVVVASGLVVAVLATTQLASGSPTPPAAPASTTTTVAAPPSSPPPPPAAAPRPERAQQPEVRVEGRSIRVGSRSFVVGRAGDRVVVGDWDCDGRATAAVLRPGSGEVFVFTRWTDDEALVVEPTEVVSRAESLRSRPGPRCDRLVVTRADGRPVTIDAGGES